MSKVPKEFFLDPEFLSQSGGRLLRILSEYIGPRHRLEQQNLVHTIVMMGSARILSEEEANTLIKTAKTPEEQEAAAVKKSFSSYYEAARTIAYELTSWSKETFSEKNQVYVCTGGGPGIMEAGNRGAQEAGGKSVGLNIELPHEEQANSYTPPELALHFRYFFMRKFWFLYFAKGFIFFPGGMGTLDEMFETLTLIQTKKFTRKIPILLYGRNFWEKTINLPYLSEAGLISPEDLDLFKIVDSVEEALPILKPALRKSVEDFEKTLLDQL